MSADRREDIIRAVDASIKTLASLFTTEATRFFTENDLVCAFHRFVSDAVDGLNLGPITDADGKSHSLIHCEYPTPFRCDMGDYRFVVKGDDDLTPGRRKYRRGHFDLAVVDPAFVKAHPYRLVKAQDYEEFRPAVLERLDGSNPVLLYGVEFVFCRDEIKPSRGADREKAAKAFVAEVDQDAAKVAEAKRRPGFMRAGKTLAFVKGTGDPVMEMIRRHMTTVPDSQLYTAP